MQPSELCGKLSELMPGRLMLITNAKKITGRMVRDFTFYYVAPTQLLLAPRWI